MTDVPVKRGDVGVVFADTLTAGGSPLEGGIAGATVLFLLRKPGAASPAVSATATVTDGTACTVEYVSQEGDLDAAGYYRQEWEATLVTGEVYTFPSDGWNSVRVVPDNNP